MKLQDLKFSAVFTCLAHLPFLIHLLPSGFLPLERWSVWRLSAAGESLPRSWQGWQRAAAMGDNRVLSGAVIALGWVPDHRLQAVGP